EEHFAVGEEAEPVVSALVLVDLKAGRCRGVAGDLLFASKAQSFFLARLVDREMLRFIGIDEGRQNFQLVTVRRLAWRSPKRSHFRERFLIVLFGADRFQLSHHTPPSL